MVLSEQQVFLFVVISLVIMLVSFLALLFSQRKLAKQQLDLIVLQQDHADNYHNHQQELLALKLFIDQQFSDIRMKLMRQQSEQSEKLQQQNQHTQQNLLQTLHQHQQQFGEQQAKAVDQLVEHLSLSAKATREEQTKSLTHTTEQLTQQIEKLTEKTDLRLKEISGEVEKRLTDGFEKTTKTFNDILQRLALIDDAQKKITELSSNVVSLQEVLADKRSRGAFGEVQLNALIRNVLPEQHFAIQHTLSNGKIADCILFLPKPTGNVIIDAKFPLESYRTMTDEKADNSVRLAAQKQFKQDIKKHINDISSKYLIEHETSDGAIMFIPAEAVFAEIHAHHNDLVEYANKNRVWLASPTTLMAILTTVRSVLKDEATRQQVHIIQQHLSYLSADFTRFRSRFDNLAKRLEQANSDVKQIHTSAEKISTRFEKIEQVELQEEVKEKVALVSSIES